MNQRELESLGSPSLQIGGFRLWVHGRQFPDADYSGGNWLRVTAYCMSPSSQVRIHGSIINLPELEALMSGCERLYQTLQGKAELSCMEPNLHISLVARSLGHIDIEISITPDGMDESHTFRDTLDQTFLKDIIRSCQQILTSFPIRQSKRDRRG